jgi:large subunit ribosomal protein L4
MVVKVYGIDGSQQRAIDLAEEVFNRSVSTGSIYHAIRNELANLRVGTASTKTRHEVRGSGAKPWRQKGTGRARSGTRQSPLWVGGGVVFGPKPRDYSYKIPKKIKRLAYKSILSQKIQEDRLMVVEDFTVESGKTRELVKILKGLKTGNGNRTAIVISGEDTMLKRAGRNVPGLSILSYNRLRAHDLFYAGTVIVFEKAAEELGRFYGRGELVPKTVKSKAKPAGLPAAKPVSEPPLKPATRDSGGAGAKAASKATAKSAAKPAAKTAEKPAAKTATKTSSKASSKPAPKASGKPPQERGGKPAGKRPTKKVAEKPAAKTATKTSSKATAKATAKKSGAAETKTKSSKSSGTGTSGSRTSTPRTPGSRSAAPGTSKKKKEGA